MAAQGLRSITVPCSTSYPCERGLRRAPAVRVRACRAESMVMTDNHSILGVCRNASRNEIKRAYRRLARLYHPDVCKDRESEQRFKQINRAYESIIKDFSRFQPETGFVCSIEDLFKSTAETEAVPDIFGDGDWFEGLNFNNPSYHQSSFMHEIMDEEAFKVTDIEEDQHKKSDDCPAWMEY